MRLSTGRCTEDATGWNALSADSSSLRRVATRYLVWSPWPPLSSGYDPLQIGLMPMSTVPLPLVAVYRMTGPAALYARPNRLGRAVKTSGP